MTEAKKRSEQHLIDADGERLLRSLLPRHWVLREYRPDYGLDFALEIFRQPTTSTTKHATYETLGEHLFIQLKSMASTSSLPLQLYGRGNVEKQPETLQMSDPVGTLDTIRFSIETSELVTIERMGVGVPVLLVLADTSTSKCYFVCLNDYIDKILIPRHGNYSNKASRTIHVPILNEIRNTVVGESALRWYAKRPKLYAAFQRFIFQAAELDYARNSAEGATMARYFASRIEDYDFWHDTEMWGLIEHYGEALSRFIATGKPDLMKIDSAAILRMTNGDADEAQRLEKHFQSQDVRELWRMLSVLPRNYEDVCREWFIPTALGFVSSYPTSRN